MTAPDPPSALRDCRHYVDGEQVPCPPMCPVHSWPAKRPYPTFPEAVVGAIRPTLELMAAWLARALDAAGYWLRPYDMTRDTRRWRWQTRGCRRITDPGLADRLTIHEAWCPQDGPCECWRFLIERDPQ